ncbi:aldose-1-epimerase [Arthrobacter sp.]|uniref:aldose-1-epimerase n=1 Tax=Arthrobacter sp. TaxID=1667 RepID=UPI0028119CCD|nr:aldose-1-epimerase [Arthrobacter sp.]
MSSIANPNGELISLEAGEYKATATTVGAGLQSLTFQGQDLVLPFPPDELPPAYAGKTLMPWPNRIQGGAYGFGGQRYEVPVNEAATGSALHGLVLWREWQVERHSSEEVTLTHRLHGQPGYPFQLELSTRYRLEADSGLMVELRAENCGQSRAPYGCGSHPYVTVGREDISNCELNFTAGKVLLTDEKLQPADLIDSRGTEFDFSVARLLRSQRLDHAFTALPAGRWDVTLRNPALRLSAVVQSTGADAPWLQLYSGELRDRQGLAVEPMSCPPDAFNSGQDLIVLEPGQAHVMSYRILALEG